MILEKINTFHLGDAYVYFYSFPKVCDPKILVVETEDRKNLDFRVDVRSNCMNIFVEHNEARKKVVAFISNHDIMPENNSIIKTIKRL